MGFEYCGYEIESPKFNALMVASTKSANEKQIPMPEHAPEEAEIRPSWTRILILAIGVGLLLAVVYLSPLRNYLSHLHEVSAQLRSYGSFAPLILTLSTGVQ